MDLTCCCTTEVSRKIRVQMDNCPAAAPVCAQVCCMPANQIDMEYEEEQGQDHVFTFYKGLTNKEREELDMDFNTFQAEFGDNLAKLDGRFQAALEMDTKKKRGEIMVVPPRPLNWDLKRPPQLEPGANLTMADHVRPRKMHLWRSSGFDLYIRKRVAIVILSGGLDRRLGEKVPKGLLNVGLLSKKSILQLYFERVQRLQHLAHQKCGNVVHIPVYIMCNEHNFVIIKDFLVENKFFGLREDEVSLFKQRNLPAIGKNGKFMLAEKHKILQFPCGNGGMFRSLVEEGMIADMKNRGVSCFFACSIDNALTKVGDPNFIGHCENSLAHCGIKLVKKMEPDESFGLFCSRAEKSLQDADGDGSKEVSYKYKATVVEFFEMTEDQRKLRQTDDINALEYNCGNLSQYFFRIDFVGRVWEKVEANWHLIVKRFPHIDLATGEFTIPSSLSDPNGYRIESWIFDALEHSPRVSGFQVSRDECAFVKNRTGSNSPASAVLAVAHLHQKWILRVGGVFAEDEVATDADDHECEISPLVSYDGEGLDGCFLKPVRLPFLLRAQNELYDSVAVDIEVQDKGGRNALRFVGESGAAMLKGAHNGEMLDAMKAGQAFTTYIGERAYDGEALPDTPDYSDLSSRSGTTPGLRTGEQKRERKSRRRGSVSGSQLVAFPIYGKEPLLYLEQLFPELDDGGEPVTIEEEEHHHHHFGRHSILFPWSLAALRGDEDAETKLEHPFGQAVGSTGCSNTGRRASGYGRMRKFWTPHYENQHDTHAHHGHHGHHEDARVDHDDIHKHLEDHHDDHDHQVLSVAQVKHVKSMEQIISGQLSQGFGGVAANITATRKSDVYPRKKKKVKSRSPQSPKVPPGSRSQSQGSR